MNLLAYAFRFRARVKIFFRAYSPKKFRIVVMASNSWRSDSAEYSLDGAHGRLDGQHSLEQSTSLPTVLFDVFGDIADLGHYLKNEYRDVRHGNTATETISFLLQAAFKRQGVEECGGKDCNAQFLRWMCLCGLRDEPDPTVFLSVMTRRRSRVC